MKGIKAKELRAMDNKLLADALASLYEESAKLKLQHRTRQLKQTHRLAEARHAIARVLTIQRERRLQGSTV